MDETVIKRVMPHNGEAEEAVIGSMLLDQDAVVLASEKLNEDEISYAKHSLLVRELKDDSVNDVHKDLVVELEEIEHHMDTDTMLNIIFDNTPCGYILVNKDNVVTFANDYALSLFGYKHEEFIDSYCDLFSENGQDQIRKDCIRMQRNVPAGKRIFDLYQSELSDDLNTYKMYVILDRTEEVTMRSRLQRSYLRLVNILQDLLNNDIDGADMTSQEKLEEIKDKAEMLSHKYGL